MDYKIKVVKKALEVNAAQAYLFVSDESRFWISGFESSYGFFLATEEVGYFFLDGRYFEKAKATLTHPYIKLQLLKSPTQVKELIEELKIQCLMVEKEHFSFDQYLFFKSAIKQIIPFPADVLRITKTNEEVNAIAKAADIVCQAMNWIQTVELVGKTEKEVANLMANKMLELDATKNSFDTIVASGKNGAYPHHRPTARIIENDEFLTVDAGCIYKGYCSDLTRTFPIGTPHPRLIKAYETVLASNLKGIEAAKYHAIGKDVDKICRDYINQTEFGSYFVHSTGHGVGIKVHELPNVSSNYANKLENNSVITIEPGIYIPELGGIRIEDMVLVQKEQSVLLTALAKKYLLND